MIHIRERRNERSVCAPGIFHSQFFLRPRLASIPLLVRPEKVDVLALSFWNRRAHTPWTPSRFKTAVVVPRPASAPPRPDLLGARSMAHAPADGSEKPLSVSPTETRRAAFRPTAYLGGSCLYLLGSCAFFAGGLGISHGGDRADDAVWSELYNAGNALFVLGSVLFVFDGYRASTSPRR